MKLDDCGCCGTEEAAMGVHNDPGLDSITVRVGDFATFKRSMHDALGGEDALTALTTRDDADPALALIDAWAVALDVLTFYNDRIANEGYLRTATEPRSLRELAREVGYLPAPATAAEADLAFTVAGVESVRIDAGTKIQSQPGQDEMPQTFETLETIVARPEWNAIPVLQAAPDTLTAGRTSARFVGTALNVKVGETLLFATSATSFALTTVSEVTTDDVAKTTRLAWSPSLPSGMSAPGVFVVRQKAAVFGHNAVDSKALPDTVAAAKTEAAKADAALTGSTLDLDAIYPAIAVDSWVVLKKGGTVTLHKIATKAEVVVHAYLMSGKVVRLTLNDSIPADHTPRDTIALVGCEPITLAERPIQIPVQGDGLALENGVKLDEGRTVVFIGKRVRILSKGAIPLKGLDGATTIATVAAGESLRVEEGYKQGDATVGLVVLRDDGTRGVITDASQGFETQTARTDDPADLAERATVGKDGKLTASLRFIYDRPSTVVLANVARASHGETKKETLGSGNAAKSFQRLTLSAAPLTYLAANTETGSVSTLQIRVDDVVWHEAPTLLDQRPRDRAYTARPNEDGKTEATFGNGVQGARLPTGLENVAATYRVGAGLVGRVRAKQLKSLLSRPLGVTEVVNPMPATGGSDGESPDDIAFNVPRSALTLGRIVSLSDFEDAASRLPTVEKAQSELLWKGDERVVYVTVAGMDGGAVDLAAVRASLDVQRDVRQRLEVGQAERLLFRTKVEVMVRADYEPEKVLDTVRARIEAAFGFDARDFAEAVTVSEILAAVQGVEGVRAANVIALDFASVDPPGKFDVLRIKPARYDDATQNLKPAQILLVDPTKIEITEVPLDL